jgi:hypothetical protein
VADSATPVAVIVDGPDAGTNPRIIHSATVRVGRLEQVWADVDPLLDVVLSAALPLLRAAWEAEQLAAIAHINELIEASSLGTPDAKAMRDRTTPEQAAKIIARSKEFGHPCPECGDVGHGDCFQAGRWLGRMEERAAEADRG